MTQALKFLRPGRTGPFSRFAWPAPGEWVDADGEAELCRTGIHAILPPVLARWVAEELWHVELVGAQAAVSGVFVAPRGRLVARIQEWNDETAPLRTPRPKPPKPSRPAPSRPSASGSRAGSPSASGSNPDVGR